MREIKFRAWNIKYKLYEDITDLYWFEEEFVHSFDDERFVFEQYTGLKDKNGKEIFEGDIVRLGESVYDLHRGRGEVCTVEWDEAKPGFEPFAFYHSDYDPIRSDDSEVIGNIHETPELLA